MVNFAAPRNMDSMDIEIAYCVLCLVHLRTLHLCCHVHSSFCHYFQANFLILVYFLLVYISALFISVFSVFFFNNFEASPFRILFKWCLLLITSAGFGEDAIFYRNGHFAGF